MADERLNKERERNLLGYFKKNIEQKEIEQKQMNKLVLILTLVVLTTYCFGQEKFIVTEVVKSFPYPNVKKEVKVNRNNIYEDSLYIVSKTCDGEWGGTIIFKNKITDIEYLTISTCPVVVNKLNNKYYVTNSLAHLCGSSQILEISNPDSLTIVELPKFGREREKKIRDIKWHDFNLRRGTKSIVDTVGVQILVSFIYNEQLYHIIADDYKTFLAKIENNKFITIDTVSNKSLWTYEPKIFISEDKHLFILFATYEVTGYLDIYENKITVTRSK